MLHVKPKAGLAIPNPENGKDLPAWGATVDNTPYWRRLVRSGDVLTTTEDEIADGLATAEAERSAAEVKTAAPEPAPATAPAAEKAPARKTAQE